MNTSCDKYFIINNLHNKCNSYIYIKAITYMNDYALMLDFSYNNWSYIYIYILKKHGKYNLISGWFNKILKRILCVCGFLYKEVKKNKKHVLHIANTITARTGNICIGWPMYILTHASNLYVSQHSLGLIEDTPETFTNITTLWYWRV